MKLCNYRLSRRTLAVLTCMVALILMACVPAFGASLVLDKTATRVEGTCSTYDVTLTIDGASPPDKAIDAVLVIDRSGSMAGTSIAHAKDAAKQFVDQVLANPLSRVALVSYGSTATVNSGFTNDATALKTAIDGLTASGTTNIKDGFDKARGEMQKPLPAGGRPCSDVNRVIVLLTDGVANLGAGSCDIWPTYETPCTMAAWMAGQTAWEGGITSVFTVGLLGQIAADHPDSLYIARETLKKAQNAGYYETMNSADLSSIYNQIFDQLDFVAKNVVVTDTVASQFTLLPATLNASKGTAGAAGNVITWNIGVVSDEVVTLTYSITANANVSGNLATNTSAVMNYNDPYCSNAQLTFPNPKVEVKPCCSVSAAPFGAPYIFQLTATVEGGKPPYSFLWNDGGVGGEFAPSATTQNPTWKAPAGYNGPVTLSLLVTDANGMQSTCSVVVDVEGPPAKSIAGLVWNDVNSNTLIDGGEPFMAGVPVKLYDSLNNLIQSTTTIAGGSYLFAAVAPGNYRVVIDPPPAGYAQTFDIELPLDNQAHVTVGAVDVTGVNFGYVQKLDYGDAPDSYGTLFASFGPRHQPVAGDALRLGTVATDYEVDGQPNATATGDDINTSDDEDGVAWVLTLTRGLNTTWGTVKLSDVGAAPAYLTLWIDFDGNGTFDPAEKVIAGQAYNASGNYPLSFAVPASAVLGDTYARFRIARTPLSLPTDAAAVAGGETEDHQVTIGDPASISGFVWNDLNGNGIWEGGEPAVENATVNLYRRQDPAGPLDDLLNPYVVVNTTSTDPAGAYTFSGLLPVHYFVQVILPDGFNSFTIKNAVGAPYCKDSKVDPATGQTAKTRLLPGENAECWNAGLIASNPGLQIDKIADKLTAKVGETINYTITVTNTGNVDLTNVTVQDAKLGLNEVIATLPWQAPNNTAVFYKSYVAQASDLPGPIVNTAVADSDQTDATTDTWTVGLIAISLDKSTPQTSVKVGETIQYLILVKNEGSVDLHNVSVVDVKLAINQTIPLLAAGDSWPIFGSYPVTVADLPGPVDNTATADSDETDPIDDSCSVPIAVAVLAIEKSGPVAPAHVGDQITYQIKVWNAGNVNLTGVVLNDAKLGLFNYLIGNLPTTNNAANPIIKTVTYKVLSSDLGSNPIHNTATADSNETDPVSDSWDVPVAAVKITKVGPTTFAVGELIDYTITVENLGSAVLHNVKVEDSKLGVNWYIGTLNPGAVVSQTFQYLVKPEDVPGPLKNTAIVTTDETPPDSDEWDIDLDPAPYGKLVGEGSGAKAGTSFMIDVVSWPGATGSMGSVMYKDPSRNLTISGRASYVTINALNREAVIGGTARYAAGGTVKFKAHARDNGKTGDLFEIWLFDKNDNIIYYMGGPVTKGQIVFRSVL